MDGWLSRITFRFYVLLFAIHQDIQPELICRTTTLGVVSKVSKKVDLNSHNIITAE